MLIDLHANVPPLELSHGAGQGLNPQPRGTGGHVLIKTKRAIAVKLGVSGKDGATGTALRSQQGDLNFWPGGISSHVNYVRGLWGSAIALTQQSTHRC